MEAVGVDLLEVWSVVWGGVDLCNAKEIVAMSKVHQGGRIGRRGDSQVRTRRSKWGRRLSCGTLLSFGIERLVSRAVQVFPNHDEDD